MPVSVACPSARIESGGFPTITVGAEVAINATALTAIATAGVYQLSYFCIGTGNNEVLVTVSGALT